MDEKQKDFEILAELLANENIERAKLGVLNKKVSEQELAVDQSIERYQICLGEYRKKYGSEPHKLYDKARELLEKYFYELSQRS